MASSSSFVVPNNSSESLLRLIASYGSFSGELDIKVDNVDTITFTDNNGQSIEGSNAAVRFIAGNCPSSRSLLGETPEDQAKIAEWLTFSQTELNPLLDDNLMKLNNWLLSRTYLVGSTITIADLVVYATVAPAAMAFPVAEHGHFCNLLRWYDHIHALADSANQYFPEAPFSKPKLVIPPPLVQKPKTKPATSDASAPASAPATQTSKQEIPEKQAASKESGKKSNATTPVTPAQSQEAPATTNTPSSGPTVDALDIRIGLITKIGPHPNADALYLEEIDLGEGQPRQVISGLRKFVTEDAMLNRYVVVVCNLKPAKMRDVMSYGMVLCASNDDHTVVEPILPPEGVQVGEKVAFEGYTAEPEAQINPKKKIFEKIAPDLMVNVGTTFLHCY